MGSVEGVRKVSSSSVGFPWRRGVVMGCGWDGARTGRTADWWPKHLEGMIFGERKGGTASGLPGVGVLQGSSDVTGAGQSLVALSTGCVLLSPLVPTKQGARRAPTVLPSHGNKGRTAETPGLVYLGDPQTGGRQGGGVYAPQDPGLGGVVHLSTPPPHLSRLREGSRSRAAGRGGGDQRPRERAAPRGEGATGSASSAPRPRRKGRGGGGQCGQS